MLLDDFDGDLGARVPGSDDEHRPFLEPRGVLVLAGVELDDVWVELIGECGHPGDLVASHRYNDIVSLEAPVPRLDHEAGAVSRQPVYTDAGPMGELEPCRIRGQIVGYLVLGGEHARRTGEGHTGQGVVAGSCEEVERVPAPAPGVADSLIRVQDQEGKLPPGEVVPDREACLSAPQNQRLHALCCGSTRGRIEHSCLLLVVLGEDVRSARQPALLGILPMW